MAMDYRKKISLKVVFQQYITVRFIQGMGYQLIKHLLTCFQN
ncbi:restriction modification system DNA specificity domain protein [Enterobacter roggenkampii]|nr:restriction modification system DNA specificity domain protein [Enterobacter roggenkampii]